MTRRKKTLLIIVLLLILILILLFLFLRRAGEPAETEPQTIPPIAEQLPEALPPLDVPTTFEPAPSEPQEQNPQIIAEIFTERYGSFSTQGNYQNLYDLVDQMTSSMEAETRAFIAATPLDAETYSGLTTNAIRSEVKNRDENTAVVIVNTQRIQATETDPRARVYYQAAEVGLVRDGLNWLVDDFTWQ